MSDFSFPPSSQTRGTVKFRTLESSFGGGYEQRSADGIADNSLQVWDLRFANRSQADLTTIYNLLKSKGGWQAFTWTPLPPFDSIEGELHVKCKGGPEWVYDQGGQIIGVTATFEEVSWP